MLKYSSCLQSSGPLRLRSRQTAEPPTFIFLSLRMAPHPAGQSMQATLAFVSCGWYWPAGQSLQYSILSDEANLPLEQTAQNVDPETLPASQILHCSSADSSAYSPLALLHSSHVGEPTVGANLPGSQS